MTRTLPVLLGRTALLAAVALGPTGLAACGSDPEPDTGDSRDGTSSTGSSDSGDSAGTPDDVDLPDAPEVVALPLQPLDRALLPNGFPADVVIADGTLQVADPMDDGWAVLLVTSYPAEQTGPVLAGAVDLLTQGGWTVGTEPSLGSTSYTLKKDGTELVLSGYPDADGAALNYNVGGHLS